MKKFPDISFTGVHIANPRDLFLSCVSDELIDENVDHSVIIRYCAGKWSYRTFEYSIASMCSIEGSEDKSLLCLTSDGKIITLPKYSINAIDESDEGPSDLVSLRVLKKIGKHLYAAGMARRVYRQESNGQWLAIDGGVFVPRDDRVEAIGFNDLAGISEDEIYGVGYKGEMWYLFHGEWLQIVSPTNVMLNCATTSWDARVYIGGMGGDILLGRNNEWELADQNQIECDLWSCVDYRSEVYFSGYDGVYAISAETRNVRVREALMASKRGGSTGYLDAKNGIIVSVGQKDVFYSVNGINWDRISVPFDDIEKVD